MGNLADDKSYYGNETAVNRFIFKCLKNEAPFTSSSCEVCHVHHDDAHGLGKHDDVVWRFVPFRDFQVEQLFLFDKFLDVFQDHRLLGFGKFPHDGLVGGAGHVCVGGLGCEKQKSTKRPLNNMHLLTRLLNALEGCNVPAHGSMPDLALRGSVSDKNLSAYFQLEPSDLRIVVGYWPVRQKTIIFFSHFSTESAQGIFPIHNSFNVRIIHIFWVSQHQDCSPANKRFCQQWWEKVLRKSITERQRCCRD